MECRRGLAMRILSACLSVCQTHDLWQDEKKLCPHSYTTWKIIYPKFVIRRMVGGATPSTWNFGSTGPRWSVIADFESIFARNASAVTPSEKSTINKEVNCALSNEPKMIIVRCSQSYSPPKRAQNAKGSFSV